MFNTTRWFVLRRQMPVYTRKRVQEASIEFRSGGGTFSASMPQIDKIRADALLARLINKRS